MLIMSWNQYLRDTFLCGFAYKESNVAKILQEKNAEILKSLLCHAIFFKHFPVIYL